MSDGPFKLKYTNGKMADPSAFPFMKVGPDTSPVSPVAPEDESIEEKIARKTEEKVDEKVDAQVNEAVSQKSTGLST